jgi:hypothetical protein
MKHVASRPNVYRTVPLLSAVVMDVEAPAVTAAMAQNA